MLSREKSFHHRKETKTVKNKEKRRTAREAFILIKRTVLPSKENKIKETSKGQNEVWTAKKGLINIAYSKFDT